MTVWPGGLAVESSPGASPPPPPPSPQGRSPNVGRALHARLGVVLGLGQENGKFPLKFRPWQTPRPPAVGTMATLGGPTGEICSFFKFGSGRFFLTRLKQRDREAKLKSRPRFLDAGGINLHLAFTNNSGVKQFSVAAQWKE